MLAIQRYIKEHGLETAIADFKLKSRVYDNKILLKYDQLVSPALMGLPEMQDCRGLILDLNDFSVISLAFRKFFNSEEGNAHKIDWNTAHILEKLDGSMMQIYWDKYKNIWFAGTSGTAEGEGLVNNKLGTTFNDLFWNTIFEKYPKFRLGWLDKKCCYVFELTTPFNIVVKPHGESSVTLLTARNLETLKEATREELIECGKALHLPVVKSYDLMDVEKIKNTFEEKDPFFEGYVVVDNYFNRVKIKSPKYVAIHHLKNRTAEHHIVEIIKTNEIEEFVATFIDRKEEIYRLKDNYDNLIGKLKNVWLEIEVHRPKNMDPLEKRKYAEAVFDICKKYEMKTFTGLYFGLNDGKVSSIDDYIVKYDNKALYNLL